MTGPVWLTSENGPPIAAGNPLPVVAGNVTYTDNSITNATGSSQQLLAANTSRKALFIANPLTNTTRWTLDPNGGTALSGGTGMINLDPGDTWEPFPPPSNKITGIATAASTLTVKEG